MRIKIIYSNSKFIIEPLDNDIKSSLIKFCEIIKMDLKNILFTYKGEKLNFNKSLTEYKTKVLIIFAFNLISIKHEKDTHDILCPGCNKLGIIDIINNNEANITKCENNHINFEIPFKNFIKAKKDDKIEKCGICGNDESLYGKPFNKCSCEKLICPLCLLTHEPKDNSINYSERFSACYKHNLPYIIYCEKCFKNLCEICEIDHLEHRSSLKSKKSYIQFSEGQLKTYFGYAQKIKEYYPKVKKEMERTFSLFKKSYDYFMKNLEGYYTLNEKLFHWMKDIKNYESMRNIHNLGDYNKIYMKHLQEILYNSVSDRINKILKFYEDKKKELTIFYKNVSEKKENEITTFKIFNEKFLNNKNICSLKIKNSKLELQDVYPYEEKHDHNLDIVKVKLIIEKNAKIDLWGIFGGCGNLIYFDEDEFTDFGQSDSFINLFSECSNLKKLPDLSLLDVSKVKSFEQMFFGCKSLTSLSDLSKWNTSAVDNMRNMFKNCESLLNLPDISKWDTNNVQNMNEMFSGCKSLISLPNISNWKTSKLTNINKMFAGCKSLTSFPDFSTWNITNATDTSNIFKDCNTSITPEIIIKKEKNESTKSFLKTYDYIELLCKLYNNSTNALDYNYNRFCEAFFIISMNKKEKINNNINNQNFSSIPIKKINSYQNKPKVIFKYPLDIDSKFNLEELAYMNFSDRIDAFIIDEPPKKKNFMFRFQNKKKEKLYLFNYFTYKKISLEKYYSEYDEKDKIEELESPMYSDVKNENKFAYIPVCFCLISKFAYSIQIELCLKSIFHLYSSIEDKKDYFVLRDFISFLINIIPIPPFNTQIRFLVPFHYEYLEIDCPDFHSFDLLDTNVQYVLRSMKITDMKFLLPLTLLINEKQLIIFDNSESRLARYCDAYLSMLYPFKWVHTYIPFLSEKNINNINLSTPFLIGANLSMIDKVETLLKGKKLKEEVYLIYLSKESIDFDLGSSLISSTNINFDNYIKKNVFDFPNEDIYWNVISLMKEVWFARINLYSKEARILNRKVHDALMNHYADIIIYIEKTKLKKQKPFYAKFSQSKIFSNYIKERDEGKINYFQGILNEQRKNKKGIKLKYDLDSIFIKYFIYPEFPSIDIKCENIIQLQEIRRQRFPKIESNDKIFDNNIELNEDDFVKPNDKIYLFNES